MRPRLVSAETPSAGGVEIRRARPRDGPALEALLSASALPIEGAREHLGDFVVAIRGTEIVGVAGLERYGSVGLLRSVAVAPVLQGRGLGERLFEAVHALARAGEVRELFLLTTTAAGYFARKGFARIERGEAPAALSASVEFQGACPASATLMVLRLAGPAHG